MRDYPTFDELRKKMEEEFREREKRRRRGRIKKKIQKAFLVMTGIVLALTIAKTMLARSKDRD
ncbi:hypothetical protein [Candidatus Nanohalobium constans]|uniref:Uncharacterized protein n=1 Tax=Candidatus Nanohalobium constans TaxID=2565781 RepID=A0A5Q0UG37_9ARCH|nr:hypothetical protein [Candidatus Nanohalobium constans]QGA80612.1 hypothetical protein LC1Nh_0724 [Candidatus Nanohalobium constans]